MPVRRDLRAGFGVKDVRPVLKRRTTRFRQSVPAMSNSEEQASSSDPPQAHFRPSRWPGWIWAVPVAAVAIVGWLGIRDILRGGPEVTVRFSDAGGIKAGDTKVKYQNMEVGEVEEIKIEDDLQHVDLTLQFKSTMAGHLGKGTRYWVAGRDVSLSDLSSIKSIISGPYVAIDPRPGDTEDHAQGLDQAPVLKQKQPGRVFALHADELGSISRDTPVYYLDLKVGEVLSYALDQNGRGFDIQAFVSAPYDDLVRPDTRFWSAGPVHLSTTPSGPSLEFQSLPALVQGAIAFETPASGSEAKPSGDNATFKLYPDHDTATNDVEQGGVSYAVSFDGQANGVPAGAPVKLLETTVGTVRDSSVEFDADSGKLRTQATLVIAADKLHIVNGKPQAGTRGAMDAMMSQLIGQGLRAELSRSAPMVGSPVVQLRFEPGAPQASLIAGSPPAIPTGAGGNIQSIIAKAGDVMNKVDRLPLDQIAEEVHQVTQRMAKLSNSPELSRSLDNLDRSLDNVQSVTADARRQVRPILDDVRQAAVQAQHAVHAAQGVLGGNNANANPAQADALPETLYELTRAARSLRELANYLDRHPESLIAGRSGSE